MPHIVTVFLYDLRNADSRMLLDRYHQAVAFDDMVVAVQTLSPGTPHTHACDDDMGSTHDAYNTRGVATDILAALLSTVWGVAPTQTTWSALHNRSRTDLLWALSDTPFSPFGGGDTAAHISWPQADASRRAILLTALLNRVRAVYPAIVPRYSHCCISDGSLMNSTLLLPPCSATTSTWT